MAPIVICPRAGCQRGMKRGPNGCLPVDFAGDVNRRSVGFVLPRTPFRAKASDRQDETINGIPSGAPTFFGTDATADIANRAASLLEIRKAQQNS